MLLLLQRYCYMFIFDCYSFILSKRKTLSQLRFSKVSVELVFSASIIRIAPNSPIFSFDPPFPLRSSAVSMVFFNDSLNALAPSAPILLPIHTHYDILSHNQTHLSHSLSPLKSNVVHGATSITSFSFPFISSFISVHFLIHHYFR